MSAVQHFVCSLRHLGGWRVRVLLHGQRDPTHVASDPEGDHESEGTHPRGVVSLGAAAQQDVQHSRQDVDLVTYVGRV